MTSENEDNRSEDNTNEKKKYPWTARRIAALIGIILLLAMYGMTMVFALMDSPASNGLLMAAIFCTIAVPILLYAMELVAKNLRGKGVTPPEDTYEDADDSSSSDKAEAADDENPYDSTDNSASENGKDN